MASGGASRAGPADGGQGEAIPDQGRGGAEGIIPVNRMGIAPVDSRMDPNLFERIVVCVQENLTNDERAMTNEQILLLGRDECRSLCHKCKYKQLNNSGALTSADVSTSGDTPDMKRRLLSYYQVLRQQDCLGDAANRPFSFSRTSWLPAEDVRMLEIFLDNDYRPATNSVFHSVPRPVLDATDGSPVVAVWTNVVGPLFNNFTLYQPEPRFWSENDRILRQCDPNRLEIPRRIPEHLRSRFATLRSRWTVVYGNWLESGGNDPEKITDYINITSPMDVTILWMFRVLKRTGNNAFFNQCLRTVPQSAQVDTGDMAATLARLRGEPQSPDQPPDHPPEGDGESPHKRTLSFELHQDLQEILSVMKNYNKNEQEDRTLAQLDVLQRNRDRAYDQFSAIESKILDRDYSQLSHTRKKRQRLLYKRRKAEWVQLEEKVSELTKIPVDKSLFEDEIPSTSSSSENEEDVAS